VGDEKVVVIAGENDLDTFGQSTAVGDVNADGKNDILVGATRDSDLRAAPDSGIVYIFAGGANLSNVDAALEDTKVRTITGLHADDGFGAALQTGDFNGDGIADLAIGAPKDDTLDVTGGEKSGAVYIYLGGQSFIARRTQGPSLAFRKYQGLAPGDRFGEYLEAGDVNGDGVDDVIIGAPGVDSGLDTQTGQVYVIFGVDSTAKGRPELPASGSASVADVAIIGEVANGHLGAIGPVRDYDGDGIQDLAVFAPFYAEAQMFAQGRCYLFLGSSTFAPAATTDADVIITGTDNQQLGDPFRTEIFDDDI
jgi:hypothetical protein